MEGYLHVIIPAHIEAHNFQKVIYDIVCYMHSYEFNIFTRRLESMKSLKAGHRMEEGR